MPREAVFRDFRDETLLAKRFYLKVLRAHYARFGTKTIRIRNSKEFFDKVFLPIINHTGPVTLNNTQVEDAYEWLTSRDVNIIHKERRGPPDDSVDIIYLPLVNLRYLTPALPSIETENGRIDIARFHYKVKFPNWANIEEEYAGKEFGVVYDGNEFVLSEGIIKLTGIEEDVALDQLPEKFI